MRPAIHVYAALAAALCVGGFLVGGGLLVTALVLAGLAVLTWRVAAASRPRPGWGAAGAGRPGGRPGGGPGGSATRIRPASAVRIRDERDAHVVHDEGREGEGVEDLMEAEPPR
ncbi:hypothetical protein SALB_06077 [Streptomyces noursei]|uniref:Uncharacterized protein n=1 Tax=Streptomyces noursei TaxID=1971 RepID=A0A401R6P5_STRNR|nr:hypothetical protein SALB_06077 [Streptomyces noursei]